MRRSQPIGISRLLCTLGRRLLKLLPLSKLRSVGSPATVPRHRLLPIPHLLMVPLRGGLSEVRLLQEVQEHQESGGRSRAAYFAGSTIIQIDWNTIVEVFQISTHSFESKKLSILRFAV